MKPEQSSIPSSEEIAKIEKQKVLSDAELLRGGAEYKSDDKRGMRLEATEDQISVAKKEMESDLSEKKGNEELFISSLTKEERELFSFYNDGIETQKNLEPLLEKLSLNEKKILGAELTKLRRVKSQELIKQVPDGKRRAEIHEKAVELFRKKHGAKQQEQIDDVAGKGQGDAGQKRIEEQGNKEVEERLTPQNIVFAIRSGKPLKVRVQRSSGIFENDWMITSYDPDDGLAKVIKIRDDRRLIEKFIPFNELKEWQKEFRPEELEENLQKVDSFDTLVQLLDTRVGVQGSRDFFEAKVLIGMIDKVRKGELKTTAITQTGGLRQKVEDLLALENVRKNFESR
jgi:hypothetical protein